jgi:hypothetical protein
MKKIESKNGVQEEKKEIINPEVKKILKEYRIDNGQMKKLVAKILLARKLRPRNYKINAHLDNEVNKKDLIRGAFVIAYWDVELKRTAEKKVEISFLKDKIDGRPYVSVKIFFPEDIFWQSTGKAFLMKDVDPLNIIIESINTLFEKIEKVWGRSYPQIKFNFGEK